MNAATARSLVSADAKLAGMARIATSASPTLAASTALAQDPGSATASLVGVECCATKVAIFFIFIDEIGSYIFIVRFIS